MYLITTLPLIIAVTGLVSNAASTGNVEDAGGFLQDPHIVGGIPATHHKYRPRVFNMIFYKGNDIVKTCKGTELEATKERPDRKLLLTAAECLLVKHDDFVIEDMKNDRLLHWGITMDPNLYRIHPDYNSKTKENNIAVIPENSYFDNDDQVLRPQLPEKGESFVKKAADIYFEWKNVTKEWERKDKFEVNSIRTKVIRPIWCKLWHPFSPSKENHVCVSGWYGKGLLESDIGTPLVTMEQNSAFKIIGIATIIRPGTHWFGLPIEFLSIDPYLDWIRSI